MKAINNFFRQHTADIRTVAILAFFAVFAALITSILFRYTQNLLKERLQERLIAIAATGAESFSAEDIEAVRTYDDIEKEEFTRIVDQLIRIKEANDTIRYAYIMRRTDDPLVLEFVADAESLLSEEELDLNENGVIEEDEATPLPSDTFEIDEYPVLRDEAFYHPSVDRELQEDQWSVQLSAYAPITDENGEAIAIFGIDVEVNDFERLTNATFLPFLLFILCLVLALSLLTVLLVRFWKERVNAVNEIDRQKDELLSIVSHQLATPVASIKWYLEMMADGELGKVTKAQKEHIETMQGISMNLSELVSMILDVSRIQLGKMNIEKQDLNLGNFFDEIIKVIEPKAKESKVEFIKSLPKKLPVVKLDKKYTHMTIENLLSNAVKYTPEGGKVEFNVTIEDGILKCTVKDNGVGIPKGEQPQVFSRMFRASNVRNSIDGNGFGLYVAKGAIEAQGGSIRFVSHEGKGTTFYVELPIS